MIKFSKRIAKVIKSAKNIALFTHIRPDFDALGSSLAMKEVLESLNKTVVFYSKDRFKETEKRIFYDAEVCKEDCEFEKFDLVIALDAPTIARIGDYGIGFSEHPCSMVIDHHPNGGLQGHYNLIDTTYSSCCEIVLDLCKFLKIKISPRVATMLYSGLSSDTNSFINTNVTVNSFANAYSLVNFGADITNVNELQYKNKSKKEVEFKVYLWSNFKIHKDCAYCAVDRDTLKKLNGEKGYTDNFSSKLITIQGINYSFAIVETKKGVYNLSMRSKNGYNVERIATRFGGGGHVCAAGAIIYSDSIEKVVEMVLSLIEEEAKGKVR